MCMQMSSANASAFALRTNNIYIILYYWTLVRTPR
nr:RLORF12 [synthetic construct]ACF49648.1 RLORF12 [synthetic construct]